jgi:dihydrofolate reductase
MSAIELVLVVAAARNGVIGRDGDLPWRLPSDLAHFKRLTLGGPMIMGRRTWASIGRALPGRTTIVVSRDPDFRAEGAEVVTSLAAAIERGRAIAARDGVAQVAVVGGGEIYAQALPLADRIERTEVALAPPLDGAVVFPALDPADWVETARSPGVRGPRDEADYEFVTLRRRRPA